MLLKFRMKLKNVNNRDLTFFHNIVCQKWQLKTGTLYSPQLIAHSCHLEPYGRWGCHFVPVRTICVYYIDLVNDSF